MNHTPGPWINQERYIIDTHNRGICTCYDMDGHGFDNARLIASAPELLEEHKLWAKIQGRIIVEALQGDFEYLKVIAQTANIECINGEPYLKSGAISKAEGRLTK